MPLQSGERVWINAGERHPAIVVRLSRDGKYALLAQGTGTARAEPHVAVDPARRVSKPLRFTKVTHFYEGGVVVRHVDEIEALVPPAMCPRAIWVELHELALARVRRQPQLPFPDEWSEEPKPTN